MPLQKFNTPSGQNHYTVPDNPAVDTEQLAFEGDLLYNRRLIRPNISMQLSNPNDQNDLPCIDAWLAEQEQDSEWICIVENVIILFKISLRLPRSTRVTADVIVQRLISCGIKRLKTLICNCLLYGKTNSLYTFLLTHLGCKPRFSCPLSLVFFGCFVSSTFSVLTDSIKVWSDSNKTASHAI